MAGTEGPTGACGAVVAAGSEGSPDASFPANFRRLAPEALDQLIDVLAASGYRVLGPVVENGVIRRRPLRSAGDLPVGWHDDQAPGSYRLHHDAGTGHDAEAGHGAGTEHGGAADAGHDTDAERFGWAVGPDSLKSLVLPPDETLWRSGPAIGEDVEEPWRASAAPVAVVGARPCELAALAVLDRVLLGGAHPDPGYGARREQLFLAVVECGAPAETCFCTAFGSGPGIEEGFDLALTELAEPTGLAGLAGRDGRRLLARAASSRGAEILARLDSSPATEADRAARLALLEGSRARMTRSLHEDTPDLLARNLAHPRWQQVAERCLSCGNCTMVCPTCFCNDVHDVSDLDGGLARQRRWASCFELSHSQLSGGPVRRSVSSRYRQWATHKLSTWHDQFGTSGCVGCGRCITWCPVGIDLTEEVAAIAASDGVLAPPQRRQAP